jgi:phospholipid/cholesterol/gamma-HCH transport system substrate-binding protein
MLETVIGAVVVCVALIFLYFAYSTAQIPAGRGYPLTASFAKLGGLPVGSDVRISGIPVGTVKERRLDEVTYTAVVTMTIADRVRLPVDSIALIESDGPIGGRYVRIEPGKSKDILAPGAAIAQTRSYRSLEDQVGEIIFLATNRKSDQGDDSSKE